MRRTTFISIATVAFSLGAIACLARIFNSWPLSLGHIEAPLWFNYFTFLFSAFMSFSGFSILKRK